jgi:hypothetical protein
MTKRTHKRAGSRAHQECPVCGRRLHGMKGLAAHVKGLHPELSEAALKAGLEALASDVLAHAHFPGPGVAS